MATSSGDNDGARKNSHDVAMYPMYTNDELQRLNYTENFYRALIEWGGTNEQWAQAVGKSTRTINRWLDNPTVIDADSLAKTCDLFGCSSMDYLLHGSYYLMGGRLPHLGNEPTRAERDRLEPDGIAKVYARLSKDDQRMVTALVNRLDRAEGEERFVTTLETQHREFVKQVVQGKLTDRDIEALENRLWEEEHIDEILREQYEDSMESVISDAQMRVDDLKAQRKEQLRNLRRGTNAQ